LFEGHDDTKEHEDDADDDDEEDDTIDVAITGDGGGSGEFAPANDDASSG
jgi:hypothetical protein